MLHEKWFWLEENFPAISRGPGASGFPNTEDVLGVRVDESDLRHPSPRRFCDGLGSRESAQVSSSCDFRGSVRTSTHSVKVRELILSKDQLPFASDGVSSSPSALSPSFTF